MRRTCQLLASSCLASCPCGCQPDFGPESQVASPVACAGVQASVAAVNAAVKTQLFRLWLMITPQLKNQIGRVRAHLPGTTDAGSADGRGFQLREARRFAHR